jgi:hypothetical protein
LTRTNASNDGINCIIILLIIIGLLSCSEWSLFGGKQRSIEQDEFWKIPSCFACPHHEEFRGINQSFFFRTFISRWSSSVQGELSLFGSLWLEIDEMRVYLCNEHYSWCNGRIHVSAGPKWTQSLPQTFSLYNPISTRDEMMFGQLESFGNT